MGLRRLEAPGGGALFMMTRMRVANGGAALRNFIKNVCTVSLFLKNRRIIGKRAVSGREMVYYSEDAVGDGYEAPGTRRKL